MSLTEPLSAKYVNTIAFETMKDIVPKMLTKVIDGCRKQIETMEEKHGKDGHADAVQVVEKLSQLQCEILSDKPTTTVHDLLSDASVWNRRHQEYSDLHGKPPTWFTTTWLYVECFVYRKIAEILHTSTYMKSFDPFMEQKNQSLIQSMNAVQGLASCLDSVIKTVDKNNLDQVQSYFVDFLQMSLWGNKCDLSKGGDEKNQEVTTTLHKNLISVNEKLLVDDSLQVWDSLCETRKKKKSVRVDIVLDNSGFEFYTDLIVADFMVSFNLADEIVFHPKPFPWFVSDVTPTDFRWTLNQLASSQIEAVSNLAKKWQSLVEEKTFKLVEDAELTKFWTTPDPFIFMKEEASQLYNYLSQTDLVLFKGDLNYRKLVGDLEWPFVTEFKTALRGFEPTTLCSLRTLKANVVVGLKAGQGEKIGSSVEDWMVTGRYGVISCCQKN